MLEREKRAGFGPRRWGTTLAASTTWFRFSPNSEMGLGGTADPAVPSGHWPDETERPLTSPRLHKEPRAVFPVPRGGSPRGTGESPGLPVCFAEATSEFGQKGRWRWRLLATVLGWSSAATLAGGDSHGASAGWRDSGLSSSQRNPSPSFSIQRDDSGWWLFSPAGQRFFSVGVCVLRQGESRETWDGENPAYAAWQHYSSPSGWADSTLRRLKSWGFTTAGGWSDFETLRESKEQTLWLTPVLNIGSAAGAPWWDMWDPKNLRRMEEAARKQILAVRDDPRLLGYYSDNELGWWNATLWKMTFEQPSWSGQRRRLLQLLRDTCNYSGRN